MEVDLLMLAEEKLASGRDLLKRFRGEYRKERKKKGSTPPMQPDQPA